MATESSVSASGGGVVPGRCARVWNSIDWSTVGLILSIKMLVLGFGVMALATTAEYPHGWLDIWSYWDALHYLDLAKEGYTATGDRRFSLVFFPLYPWLVRAGAMLAGNHVVPAFVVSGIASVAAGLFLQKLVRLDQSEAVADRAVWFLFIFPTSYFLHIAYTESLFLALALGCVFAARTDRWLIGGLLGACACMTRINGLILVPLLAVEAWQQYRATRRWDIRWLSFAIPGLGFAGYLGLNFAVTGNVFAFSALLEEHWAKRFAPPWIGIWDVWVRVPDSTLMEGFQELFFVVLGFVCTIWCWLRLRPSYGVWMTGNWLLFNSTALVMSVPRYTLVLFPMFILLARLGTARPLFFYAATVWCLLSLALFASEFVQGYWAF